MKKEHVSFFLDKNQKKEIEKFSKLKGKNLSETIRELIEKGLKEAEVDQKIEKISEEISDQIFKSSNSIQEEFINTDKKILDNKSEIKKLNQTYLAVNNQLRLLENQNKLIINQLEINEKGDLIKSEINKMISQFIDSFASETILLGV